MKKILTVFLLVLSICVLSLNPAFATAAPRLVDDADLLTSSEESELLSLLNEISERQKMDIVVVTVDSLGGILRMIPMRRITMLLRVLFFHASQIGVGSKGILFTAPSGTGKTTQAKLWRKFRGVDILCNDRTLTDGTLTYGFPTDGSEPVITGERRTLGAIVVLEQAPENAVRRLRPREILPRLMPQLVLDAWDPASASAAMELLLDLIPRTPVYLLAWTPDESAVRCLERQLVMDGVISHENDPGTYL